MSSIAQALPDPIVLPPNRLPRFYRSGRLPASFRGAVAGGQAPEDWVGSATRTWTPVAGSGLDIVWCLGPDPAALP